MILNERSALEDNIESAEVYITKSNFQNLVFQKANDKRSFEDLYKTDLSTILTVPELALLQVFKDAYEHPEDFLTHYKKRKAPVDTKKWVFEGSRPAYHCNLQCERLNSAYLNLEIPEEIRYKGDEEIRKFRAFTKEHISLLTNDEARFLIKLELRFGLKNPPQSVKKDNSSSNLVENYSLEELEQEIDSLLVDAEKFRHSSESVRKIINDKGYGTNRLKEASVEGHPLNLWHNKYKQPLKSRLQEYFKVKLNKELKFEGKLLDQLGFVSCKSCCDSCNTAS